jgi:hypothetical protein
MIMISRIALAAGALVLGSGTLMPGVASAATAAPVSAATTYSCYYSVASNDYLYAGWSSTLTTNTAYGQANDRVKEVQCLLTEWAYDHGAAKYDPQGVDGQFGSNTKAAVINAQKYCFPSDSSQWDGEVGPKTWPCLRYYW